MHKNSTKHQRHHPLPTEGINDLNTTESHHIDKRFSWSITSLMRFCFENPTATHTHTYQRVAEVVMLEAFGHHAIMWWNHFKIPPRCHSDSVEEHLTPILRDSHLTALQRLLQQWLQRRRGFITVIMGNHGDVTRWMTHSYTCNVHWAKSHTDTVTFKFNSLWGKKSY